VPRALVRRDTRGFLMRVDVQVGAAGRPEAELVVADFMRDFLPEVERIAAGERPR